MTVASETSRVTYAGDAVTLVFTIPFNFLANSDIQVALRDSAGTPVVLSSGYAIAGAGTGSGTCTMTAVVAVGKTLDIYRQPTILQPMDLVANDKFPAETVETAHDRQTFFSQYLRELVKRCIQVPAGDGSIGLLELPVVGTRASKNLGFDSSGNLSLSAVLASGTLSADTIGSFLYDQSLAEIAALVTPTFKRYIWGDVRRYAAVGDGATNDATAFANAALVSGTHPMLIYKLSASGYLINTPIVLPANAQVQGYGRPLLKTTVAGNHIMSATAVATVSVDGVLFQGLNSSTAPSTGFGGYSANNTGLLTITNCTDVRVTNCDASTFYNGITTQKCTRLWVKNNRITRWTFCGILASLSSEFMIDENELQTCDQAGAVVAYGITATGDQNGGTTQQKNSISFNRITDVKSWDGIMSHDCDGLQIIGNDIRGVRTAIDVGHLVSTNFIKNIIIANNYCEGTTTDTWGGAAANMGGILAVGYDATHRIDGLNITGNTVRGFFNVAGGTLGGIPSNIVIYHADNVAVNGNVVLSAGGVQSNAGIYVGGTINRLAIAGNSLSGTMPSGGIRLANVTGDMVAITGNIINQGTPAADAGIISTGSTVTALAVVGNTGNSAQPIAVSTSTLTYVGQTFIAALAVGHVTLAYSANIQVDASLGTDFSITATNGTAFTINSPTNLFTGQELRITIRNTSGGALGVITWGALFKMAAWVSPATANSRSIMFKYDGTNLIELTRTAADVPN